mmetsp:Transcript_44629/g.72672  ORF Transcript_44629/g.72672 Transcript_44629/m.72672 type:complete len:311 (-) Transcript_44629:748-1680(-)|eukprot:CAMPEP_0184657628 /NCGR_PEP_ID=MMETSP0308-20130426/20736_1 /TAXON_ID=38269 /ORGANISM="Gloeochaete witrockiana, Strain SAG 46.84" /LENGTH=310 /DNA_ID=CAMNT_0027095691 /DNA_START=59 /DNA_END=991 /DNA_ORIENTATION=+
MATDIQSNIHITVSFRGRQIPMSVSDDGKTVLDLKTELSEQVGVSVDAMKLVYKGNLVSDEKQLKSFPQASRLLLTASTPDELSAVNSIKSDPTLLPFDRKRSSHAPPARVYSTSKPSEYGFASYGVLPLPQKDVAMALLQRLANDAGILAIMTKHRWRVGRLAEMYPEGLVGVDPVCVLGYNTNKGQEITLRLRTDDMKGFRHYNSLRKVLFHELAHNVHSEHTADFYNFTSQLEKEAEKMNWTKGRGHTTGQEISHSDHFENETQSLSESSVLGGDPNLQHTTSPRTLAAQAAMRRNKNTSPSETEKP